ncbi:MAG TPA: hypothetical protein VE398_08055 [Acidobacteriota bacterium]|nr:hypothetical protein [Acidobacteriota bacterium]
MSIIEFIVLLIVAGVCGSLGQAIVGYSHGGCLLSIGLGVEVRDAVNSGIYKALTKAGVEIVAQE